MTARLTAMSAGWAFAVSVSSSAGPSHITVESFWESAASTSSNTARARGKASARALPMPTAWLPCPGNTNARVIAPRPGKTAARVAEPPGGVKNAQAPMASPALFSAGVAYR